MLESSNRNKMSADVRFVKPSDLLRTVESLRLAVAPQLDLADKATKAQYFTPLLTARFMASMLRMEGRRIRVLDPGAGIGMLSAAWVSEMLGRTHRPSEIHLTAFENDAGLIPWLRQTLILCEKACQGQGISCRIEIRQADFIEQGVAAADRGLFTIDSLEYDTAILNPPYKKIRSDSQARNLLRRIGIETSNLYTAFLSLALMLLRKGGEFVSITPRSFCNGPYFRPFREHLLKDANLKQFHLFESRDKTFQDDGILQENVILHASKSSAQDRYVRISQSRSPADRQIIGRKVPIEQVVLRNDPEKFIHLVPDKRGHALALNMEALPCTLKELGLSVSTGRVIDFRSKPWLRAESSELTVPLIYPGHINNGRIVWPNQKIRKPNAILLEASKNNLLVKAGIYVLVKRFSAKEERKRITAAVFDPMDVPGHQVGFENHLNYYHENGEPLALPLARGLAAFLNSSYVDLYFRQFNGHTQVNATDLRMLRYPDRRALMALGQRIQQISSQEEIDHIYGDLFLKERESTQ
jgi:adenine-specific DNA-methyltransferase